MKDYEKTKTMAIPQQARMAEVRAKYRKALLLVGKSPDYHIFDLDEDFVKRLKDGKPRRFLIALREFFFALDAEDQRIFVMDVLEHGRHYPFWYLEDYTRKEYEKKLRDIVMGVPRCLA